MKNHESFQFSMYLSTTLDPSHLNLNFFYKRFDVNKINAKNSYLTFEKVCRAGDGKKCLLSFLRCLSLLLLMLSPRHVESSYFYIIKMKRDMTITMCIICCARTLCYLLYFMCVKECLIFFIYIYQLCVKA